MSLGYFSGPGEGEKNEPSLSIDHESGMVLIASYTFSLLRPIDVDVILPNLQMRKLRLFKANRLVQGLAAGEWFS